MKLKLFLYLAVLLCLAHTLALAGGINDTVWTKQFPNDVGRPVYFSQGSSLLVPCYDSVYIVESSIGKTMQTFPSIGIGYHHNILAEEQEYCYYTFTDSSFHIHSLQTGIELRKIKVVGIPLIGWINYSKDGRYAVADFIPDVSNPPKSSVIGLGWIVIDLLTGEVKQKKLYPTVPMYKGVSINKVFLSANADTVIAEVHRSYGDGQNHWTYSNDIILYDVATGDSVGVFQISGENIFQNSDGSSYLINRDSTVYIYELRNKISYRSFNVHQTIDLGLRILTLSRDNSYLYIGSLQGLDVWDVSMNSNVYEFKLGTIYTLVISPYDNRKIIIGSGNTIGLLSVPLVSIIHDNIGSIQKIFPNPTTNQIQLKYTMNKSGEVCYSVNNLRGENLLKGTFGYLSEGEHLNTLAVSTLPSGTYYLRLLTPDGITTYNVSITK